jgi:subtilase family serine protease
VAIPGTHPAWAVATPPAAAPAVTTGTINARVYLAGQNAAGLSEYATAVSTPGNPLYGDYLSAEQVQAEYGPTSAEVAAVQSWLQEAGLKVTQTSDVIGGYVAVSGSVAAARKAFGVTFGAFEGPEEKLDRAPEQSASAPAAVAPDVLSVAGLSSAKHYAKHLEDFEELPPPEANYWIPGPTSGFYGEKIATNEPKAYGIHQPWTNGGYTPRQIRGAYGVSASGMTGRGQTVAVIDAYGSPTMLADANEYSKVNHEQPFRPGQYEQYLPSTFSLSGEEECDAPGWYGEETLDVESVHGEAPEANVRYVGASSCESVELLAAATTVVHDHLASIVSNSYAEPSEDEEELAPAYESLFKAAAAEGIGFFFSSGDNGYDSPEEDPYSKKIQVESPASSPWVTAVGGTSLAIGPFNNYEFETSWGTLLDPLGESGKVWEDPLPGNFPEYFDGAGGGGVSTTYHQPFYQRGVVPHGLATKLPDGETAATPMRVVPDVAALADPSTGFLVGETTLQPDGKTYAFSLSRIGGTSLAAPTFSGIEADAQQAAGHPLGFANPAIYQRYGTLAFHDVTDTPFGPGVKLAEVRNNYTDPYTREGPLKTYLRTLGIDGEGESALPAVRGFDDATGVGSPSLYVESFFSWPFFHH